MNQKETKSPEQQAIHKWIFFGYNACATQIDKMLSDIAGSEYDKLHLAFKYTKYGYDLNRFYCECDSTLGKRMVEWVMTHYNG